MSRGITLIDTLVGVALLGIVFVGIASVFQYALDVVTNNKARTTAIALANARMEEMRSIPYENLGTVAGIPAGILSQSESIKTNGIHFTRKTYVQYTDSPADGLGVSDQNGIPTDYKTVQVTVQWKVRGSPRDVTITASITPVGIESDVNGGTLIIRVINAVGAPVPGASVHIINSSLSPTVDISTLADTDGVVAILGAPVGTEYQIIVTAPGYSSAQTYDAVSGKNPNPTPGHLSVALHQITTATFSIDRLATKIVHSVTPKVVTPWEDTFDSTHMIATSDRVHIASGEVTLSTGEADGSFSSIAVGTSTLVQWRTLTVSDSQPTGTSILYRVYDGTGSQLIPDTQIPGNSAGLHAPLIDISGVSADSYQTLVLKAFLTTSNTAVPSVYAWSLTYVYGLVPVSHVTVTITGSKTIGTAPNGSVNPKFSTSSITGTDGIATFSDMEWDNYSITVDPVSGFDAMTFVYPQPEALAPGSIATTTIWVVPHTPHSLIVDVHYQDTGALVSGALVRLTKGGTDLWETTNEYGQAFFSNLSSATNYEIDAGIAGHATTTLTSVNVDAQSTQSILIQ